MSDHTGTRYTVGSQGVPNLGPSGMLASIGVEYHIAEFIVPALLYRSSNSGCSKQRNHTSERGVHSQGLEICRGQWAECSVMCTEHRRAGEQVVYTVDIMALDGTPAARQTE